MHLLPKVSETSLSMPKLRLRDSAAATGGYQKYVCGKCRGRLLEIGNDEKSQVEK